MWSKNSHLKLTVVHTVPWFFSTNFIEILHLKKMYKNNVTIITKKKTFKGKQIVPKHKGYWQIFTDTTGIWFRIFRYLLIKLKNRFKNKYK